MPARPTPTLEQPRVRLRAGRRGGGRLRRRGSARSPVRTSPSPASASMPTGRGPSRRRWPARTARPASIAAAAAHATDGIDGQRRHPRRPRVPDGDGRRLHPPRDRGRARPARPDRAGHGVRVERVTPGKRAPARLAGSILARDLDGRGRALVQGPAAVGRRPGGARRRRARASRSASSSPRRGELHEDDAALRLAAAVAGPGLTDARPGPEPGRPRRRAARRGQRPGRRPRAAQPDRSARGLHRVRRPGRRAGRPRRQRQGRAAPRRGRDGRRRRAAGRLRQPTRSSGSRRSCRAGSA